MISRILVAIVAALASNLTFSGDIVLKPIDITKECGGGLITSAGFVRGESNQVYLRIDDGRIVQCILRDRHAQVVTEHSQEGRAMLMPAWSPDGQVIAYVHYGDIYLFRIDSRRSLRVTTTGHVVGPKLLWKNNMELFFTATSQFGRNINVVNLESLVVTALVSGRGYYSVQDYVNKSGHIYYAFSPTGASPHFDLFVANVNDSGLVGRRILTAKDILTEGTASVTADEQLLATSGSPGTSAQESYAFIKNMRNGRVIKIEHEKGWSDDYAEISRDGMWMIMLSTQSGIDPMRGIIRQQHIRLVQLTNDMANDMESE